MFTPTRALAAIPVRMPPGCTVVTLAPTWASSARSASENPRIANFDDEYADCPGGDQAEQAGHVDHVRAGRAVSAGSRAWVSRTGARKLTSMTQSNSSRVSRAKSPPSATPALLTRSLISG